MTDKVKFESLPYEIQTIIMSQLLHNATNRLTDMCGQFADPVNVLVNLLQNLLPTVLMTAAHIGKEQSFFEKVVQTMQKTITENVEGIREKKRNQGLE